MLSLSVILIIASPSEASALPCKGFFARRFVSEMENLPSEIRKDLISKIPDLVDSGKNFQATDTVELGKKNGSHHRFLSAYLIKD